ncbi:unnamed protein product [Phytomonas sp. Hart1]|nr:unnamed protein product [Phytomonas sp. Hart1]|eukprot:CCW68735.1 unnamed protein product [Phytomonas sp. isolate Hart1]
MDCQTLLDGLAKERGLSLTPLARMGKYPRSRKIECCGGLVVRVECEGSADSTVCIQDGSGLCFCAIHGDITSRYPDVLSTGAVLLFQDITLLLTGGKMPPVLIACMENLVGLLLPDASEPPLAREPTTDRDGINTTPRDQMGEAVFEDSGRITYPSTITCSPIESRKIAQGKEPERLIPTNDSRQIDLLDRHHDAMDADDDENCLELVDDL